MTEGRTLRGQLYGHYKLHRILGIAVLCLCGLFITPYAHAEVSARIEASIGFRQALQSGLTDDGTLFSTGIDEANPKQLDVCKNIAPCKSGLWAANTTALKIRDGVVMLLYI